MSEGFEYRVKWRANGERQVKRFADLDAAQVFVGTLAGLPVTDVRLQARRVEAWRDVET